jgi:hypothetical protein
VQRIAQDHRCTVDDVNAALDRHPVETDRAKYVRRLLALELVELDELQEAFRDKAIVDRDVASGALLTKIHERRATLLGLNAPASAAVHVIEHERPPAQTSTDRLEAAVNRIRAVRACRRLISLTKGCAIRVSARRFPTFRRRRFPTCRANIGGSLRERIGMSYFC